MKKIFMLVMLTLIMGCGEQGGEVGELSRNGEIAKNYIESKGYEVVSFEKEKQVIHSKEDILYGHINSFGAYKRLNLTNI